MSIASVVKDGSGQKLSVAQNVNVMLPRMLQRRFAVSSESSRPGTFDDDKFVIQSYPKSQAQQTRIHEILSGIVLFQGVSETIMKDLVGGFYGTKFNNGDKIIVQGDMIADRFFLLESGQCDIFIQKGSADPLKVHTVLPGGFFGELALLYNAPRAATVISNGESRLWALDRGTFKNCMARASKVEAAESGSSLLKAIPKASILQTQHRGSLALMDEQVMKALDQKSKAAVILQSIPGWHTIANVSINSDKFIQMLFKFNHPHISLYKLSDMDATNLQTLLHADVEPRHFIFLPMCKLEPTGVPNTVMLVGHHLDGTITLKFTLSSELSKFLDIAEKSKNMHSKLDKAAQNVRYASAGGNVQEIETGDQADPSFYGVGLCIDVSKNGSSFSVREIVPGSPAAACGLISVHDHLVKIDGLSAKHSCPSLDDVVKLICGIEGTKVNLQFRKSSGPKAKSIYEVTLIREKRGPNLTKDESVSSKDENLQRTVKSVDTSSDEVKANFQTGSGLQPKSLRKGASPTQEPLITLHRSHIEQFPQNIYKSKNRFYLQREEESSSVDDSEYRHTTVKTETEVSKEHLTSHNFQNAAAAFKQQKSLFHESDDSTKDFDSNMPDNDPLQHHGELISLTTHHLHSSPHDLSNRGSRTASKKSSRTESPFEGSLRQNAADSSASSLILMRQIAREEITRQILEDEISLPQHPLIRRVSESDEQVTRYLEAYRTATDHLSSPNVVKRPILQVFATNMGITLLSTHDGRYQVHSISSNAPASVHHVCVGDLLWAINREPVASLSKEEVCKIFSHPNTDVHLSLCRYGTDVHMIVRRPVHQPDYNPAVGSIVASTANSKKYCHPRLNIAMSVRTDMNHSSQRLTARPSPHTFAKDSHDRFLSSGFSVNKSDVGSIVVTGMSSSDIRRMEVDDVIATVDGRVVSSEDTLDDIVCLLEEPSGTIAQVKLLKDSGGSSGVMRKTTQFLRRGITDRNLSERQRSGWPPSTNFPHTSGNSTPMVWHGVLPVTHGGGAFGHPHAHNDVFLQEPAPPTFPPRAYFDEEGSDDGLESSDLSTCTTSLSSAVHEPSFACSDGVGLAFSFDKTPIESSFYVDFILPNSPADSCGQINVGDKLIKINGRSTCVEQSLQSFLSHMAGPVGSQVALKFVKPDSDMKYSITLTRSPLMLHHENALPIFTSKYETIDTPRLPFQVLSPSFPSPTPPPYNFAQEALLETNPSPSISTSFETSASTFARIRAERDKSIDFNAAFRKKGSDPAAAIHAHPSPPPPPPPRSSAQITLHEANPTPSTSISFETSASTFARVRAERDKNIDFNAAFRKTPVAAIQVSKTKFSFKDMFFPSNIGQIQDLD